MMKLRHRWSVIRIFVAHLAKDLRVRWDRAQLEANSLDWKALFYDSRHPLHGEAVQLHQRLIERMADNERGART